MTARTHVFIVRSLLFLSLLGAAFLAATPVRAQMDTGSILGTVSDQSGSVISGATVTLTNEGTGAALSTTTGAAGEYTFSPVKIGSYKIDVTFKGFQTVTTRGVSVDVGAAVVQNFTMKPGQVSETIEVSAAPPLLESQSAAVGQVVDQKSVNDLPLNGRNFTFLAQISAGVNTPQADTRGNAATGAFAANGLRPAQNNYLLDGIDNNSDTVDFLNGTNFVALPPIDAIQEFKVQTSDFSAEFGRSGAAIINATMKSGTNDYHGDVWEFFRNDKLDAADFFENAGGIHKGELRQNQFGGTFGGPVIIPHILDGHNKVFFFADYEGLRRIQGTILSGSVPTAAERASGYTDFSDLIDGQNASNCLTGAPTASCATAGSDALGRIFPLGTVFDPATTRAVTAGQVDPVTGLTATSTGFVRTPFGDIGSGACPANTVNFTGTNIAACQLNQIPVGRLDANAIKLLNLYPNPTTSALFGNFANSPKLDEHRNAFDTRMDVNLNANNQVFFRFDYSDDPQFIPGIFGGVADGGAFQQGNQTALAQNTAIGYTHVFSPSLINEVRLGFSYLHTTRSGPVADENGIPAEYGIQGVPQGDLNGGLPAFGINGLATLGSNSFLPSNETSQTLQLTDDVTKIYGKHTFKMGFEWQHIKFTTLQPPWSHGEYDYNGAFTDVPAGTTGNTGRVDFLLTPTLNTTPLGDCGAAAAANCPNYVGGSSNVYVSNIFLTDDGKQYYGGYVNDSWKLTNKLTLNLGLRYDYFTLVKDNHSNQANFVPSGGPLGGPAYIIPKGPYASDLSPSFLSLLQQDGIALDVTNAYGGGLGHSQNTNFAPRLGFAYQVTPKLVVRAGWGMFYDGFENRGYSPNLGENYPFQFDFNYVPENTVTPITFPGCSTAGPGNTATFETGFSCTSLDPTTVNASGLQLRGIQFNYKTPYSMGANLTVQYQLTPTVALQAAYVDTEARHLEVFPGSNEPSVIAPASTPLTSLLPFPDFGEAASYAATEGDSIYHGLQTQVEKRFGGGLTLLANYTWSKTLSDAHDLLNGGSVGNGGNGNVNGYRAPDIPGMGITADYGLAPSDIRNVFHLSGTYELPVGKGKKFMSNASGWVNQVVGGWATNWLLTLQDGQPITLSCPTQTAQGVACGDLRVAGQPLDLGLHTDANGKLSWFGNPNAFTQPCVLGAGGTPEAGNPIGCVPLTGTAALGALTQVPGPGFHRFDWSIFKNFPISETKYLQFRAEFFNLTNHPNFNAPNFGGNGVVAISGSGSYNSTAFGEIGSTRDDPYDPRQIQFALKFYF
jgi:hypothetical protein